MSKLRLILCLIIGFGSGACSTAPTESLGDFRETIFIEGFLRAGTNVSGLFVGTTMPLSSEYNRDASALSDADVAITVDGVTHSLAAVPDKPGVYHQPDLVVQPGKTYHLSVKNGLGTATAQTTVPFPPRASGAPVLYAGGDPYRVTWEGETNGGFVTSRQVVELLERIPPESQFGGGRFGGGFGGTVDTTGFGALRDSIARADQWRFLQGQSQSLNPIQFSYYGTYALLVYALDGNYGDFLISSQQDEAALDEPRFHVEGGIGLFASMAADSVLFGWNDPAMPDAASPAGQGASTPPRSPVTSPRLTGRGCRAIFSTVRAARRPGSVGATWIRRGWRGDGCVSRSHNLVKLWENHIIADDTYAMAA